MSEESKEQTQPSVEQRLFDQASSLGFIEPIDLRQIRESCTPGQMIEQSRSLEEQYTDRAYQYVEKETEGANPQIGLAVALAGLSYRNGSIERSKEHLEAAIFYSETIGDMEIAEKIKAILLECYDIKHREI